ncbi:MAG: RsmE family RNA methyltransferase [Patescibacteria group bacterium]
MHRFFLKNFRQTENEIKIFNPEQIHQIKNVLRLKPGQEITIFDSSGRQFLIILESINNFITGKVIKEIKQDIEPKIKIVLYQSLIKKDKFEWLIKQGTALGISKFVPLITDRSIVRRVSEEKFRRWQKIVQESTEQSGRTNIPIIAQPINFKSLTKQILNKIALNLIGQPNAKKNLKQVLPEKKPKLINLFIGPEGGFSESEIKLAKKLGLKLFRFGPRILPAEFAGLAIASVIFYHYNNI